MVLYRYFYMQMKEWLKHGTTRLLVLYGPRKVGKTYALKQLSQDCKDVAYLDCSKDNINVQSLDTSRVYILDEFTQMSAFDDAMRYLADWSECRVILSGSSMWFLRSASSRYLSNLATNIYADFIDYYEWCVLVGAQPNAESYRRFVFDFSSPVKLTSGVTYLKDCVTDTIHSSACATHHMPMWYTAPYEEAVLHVLYTLIAGIISQSYKCSAQEFDRRYHASLRRYNLINIKEEEYRDAMRFLVYAGFVFPVYNNSVPNVDPMMFREYVTNMRYGDIRRDTLYAGLNICITSPILTSALLADVGLSSIDNSLFGILYESHMLSLYRRLTQNENVQYYRKDDMNEVDLVDPVNELLIEFTIRNKSRKDVHFNAVPNYESYRTFITSRDKYPTEYWRVAYNWSKTIVEAPKYLEVWR